MKNEVTKLAYNEMAELVAEKFIKNADSAFLKKVAKAVKGGFLLMKSVRCKANNFNLLVDKRPEFLFWLNHRMVWVTNKETGEYYELSSEKDFPKFYEAVKAIIDEKKNNM